MIPAHPLALDSSRKLDVKHQRALTRYYLAAGAAGVAVAVHTTQFAIRQKGMLEPVLRIAAETLHDFRGRRPLVKVAGVCGPTEQAVREAELASGLGYDLALLSPVGVEKSPESTLLDRARRVAEVMPVFGFYLQPSVGGRRLTYDFWKELAGIPGVMAVKVAPFSRYETGEVVRAVANSGRARNVSLYTGNDDNIVHDMLSEFTFIVDGNEVRMRFVGGLLGQFAVWTLSAVLLLKRIQEFWESGGRLAGLTALLGIATELTDANSAIFDSSNEFAGSIVGVQEVLRRQGLVRNCFTLAPAERLSAAQSAEIGRVITEHPGLHAADDAFVSEHLAEWLE